MKTTFKLLALVAAMAVTASSGVRAAADPVTLSSVEAVFETTTNDKDHDSLVTVTVKRGNTIIASMSNIGGKFDDHSNHSYSLDVAGTWTRDDLKNRTKTELSFSTNGNDKWEFNYVIRLNWSDGTTTEQRWNGQVLTQNDRYRSYAISL